MVFIPVTMETRKPKQAINTAALPSNKLVDSQRRLISSGMLLQLTCFINQGMRLYLLSLKMLHRPVGSKTTLLGLQRVLLLLEKACTPGQMFGTNKGSSRRKKMVGADVRPALGSHAVGWLP